MSQTPENNFESALTYSSYLAVDELLQLQRPLSEGPEHDEMLFIVIHQTYELWFKQLIHEFTAAQKALEAGDTHRSLAHVTLESDSFIVSYWRDATRSRILWKPSHTST